MDHVSRPLIAVLVASVAFFALWTVALKPTTGSGSGSKSTGGVPLQSAIAKAHQAVTASDNASRQHGGTIVASRPASTTAAPATTTAARATTTTAPVAVLPQTKSQTQTAAAAAALRHAAGSPAQQILAIKHAINTHKALALLFYNPAGADDRAVKQELAAVPAQRGKVVKFAVPLSQLAQYTIVTNQVPVNVSPTLVLIDPAAQATTIVGFADRFEIAERVSDALAVPAPK